MYLELDNDDRSKLYDMLSSKPGDTKEMLLVQARVLLKIVEAFDRHESYEAEQSEY